MAIINGATTPQAIINAWKMSIMKILKVRSPLARPPRPSAGSAS